jgi:protein-S-isoprenylcysteine O-methyltransferase Ste14
MKYIILVICWAAYFAAHSIFAMYSVKDKIGLKARTYRLIYAFLSTIGLLAILFYNGWIGGENILSESGFLKNAALFLGAGGVIVLSAAFRNYSFFSFIGLKEERSGELVTTGINAWVRHPIYTGTILITLGLFLFDPRLATMISVLCIWIYLWIGIRLEEKKLVKIFGDKYRAYQQDVAAVIPFLL